MALAGPLSFTSCPAIYLAMVAILAVVYLAVVELVERACSRRLTRCGPC